VTARVFGLPAVLGVLGPPALLIGSFLSAQANR
jgi:hypothetical protein